MTIKHPEPAEFTGRRMLLIMVAFFGVIIAVNIGMAVVANKSWTGFVVPNSYVASQEFNGKMAETRAQAALGWVAKLEITGHDMSYALADRAGVPVALKSVSAIFRRPVDDREDHKVVFDRHGRGDFATDHRLANGVWLVEIDADAGLDKPYRETRRIHIVDGAMQ